MQCEMGDITTIGLRNIDPDDISDVLAKIETSFDIKFGDMELKGVRNFGELCDIITNKVQGYNVNDCTTQQAFYKLRNAIAATQFIDKDSIVPNTTLKQLFPRHKRIQKIGELQNELGMPVDILDTKAWIGWTIVIGIVLSLFMFFFKWQFALSGFVFFIVVGWTTNKFFAKEFELTTVGQLAKKLARENYLKSRRDSSTINRKEIAQKVTDFFSKELALEEEVLTKQATFE
jgi:hypothetical protein